jgi:hypothetical protein
MVFLLFQSQVSLDPIFQAFADLLTGPVHGEHAALAAPAYMEMASFTGFKRAS